MKLFQAKLNSVTWRYWIFSVLVHMHFFGAVLVPFFTSWGHISLFQVQLLQSWFMLWIFLLEVPTGAIADHIGRKHSVAFGTLFMTLAVLVYGSIPRFEVFLLGEFLFALGVALISGADEALIYDSLRQEGREGEAKHVLSKAHSFDLTGMLIGALLGGFIAAWWGLNIPLLVSAIPIIIAGAIMWSITEPQIRTKSSESKRYLETMINGFKFFYQHRKLRVIALDGILVASSAYFVLWFYQPLLQNAGVEVFWFGIIQALLVGVEILISASFVSLEKWVGGAKNYLRLSALLVGIFFILVAVYPNIVTILLFVIVSGGLGLTRLELMSAYIHPHIPSEQRATVLSSISMFRRIALVVLNPAIGFIASGSLSWALAAAGALSLAVFTFSPLEKETMES